jgi:hypothetical protein
VLINKVVSLFKGKAFKFALLAALFLTSTIIALAMLLGREAGTFVIRVQDNNLDKAVAITDKRPSNGTTTGLTSKLSAPGVTSFTDYSPEYFLRTGYVELDRIQEEEPGLYTPGYDPNKSSPCSLYVYTFYIVNTGTSVVNVDVGMTYAKDLNTSDPKIYQKQDNPEKYYDKYILPQTIFAEANESSGVVYDDQKYIIGIDEGSNFLGYSIYFWIEGEDPDETTEVFGATINFSVNITVNM